MITQRQSDKIFELAYVMGTAAVKLERADFHEIQKCSDAYAKAEHKLQDYLMRLRLGQEES